MPNMLVNGSVLGTKKTVVFVCLVVIMATAAGMIYGNLVYEGGVTVMTKIEILGPGCPKCHKTAKMVEEEIAKTGLEAEVSHVTDINEIVDRGVMMTPAVIIDGKVVVEGKVPSAKEIKSWLS